MSASMAELAKRIEELERRQSQMIVRGKVAAVKTDPPRLTVQYGENQTTGWLPWKPPRSGEAVIWWVPEVGEGVTVLSDGDLSHGEVVPGSYSDEFPPPSTDPNLFLMLFGDGGKFSYNRANGAMALKAVGDLAIDAGANLKMTAGDTMELVAGGGMSLAAPRIDLNQG